MATTFSDIHPNIIQIHILPRLDGPSLFSIATTCSHLQTLVFSDEKLWSDICKSTWPSIAHPRLRHLISTFPSGHRSFFRDSFPALVSDINNLNRSSHNHPWPSQIISAVDIRYENDIVYSKVEFTETTAEFLSSDLRIKMKNDVESEHSRPIKLNIVNDDFDEETFSRVEESLSLNWILIDPTRKRAGNLSSVRPICVRQGSMTNQIYLVYAIVLPWCDPNNKMVQCKIEVVLSVDAGSIGFYVKEVMLELMDFDFCRLKGREFLEITQGALLEENNVRRKMVDDEESRRRYKEFKRISINTIFDRRSSSNYQLEVQSNNDIVTLCHSLSQISFQYLFKAQLQCSIIRLNTFEFVICIIFVVILCWLMDLYPLV